MRYIVLLLLGMSFQAMGNELPACNVSVSKNIEKQLSIVGGKIVTSVTGAPCYESKLTIKIFSGQKLLYSYSERFKPHVAIHWERVVESDATNFIKRQVEDYNFINCTELPEVDQSGDLPYYNDLLISKKEYTKLKNSNCKAYIHTYKHYEGNRIIVFPAKGERAIVVR